MTPRLVTASLIAVVGGSQAGRKPPDPYYGPEIVETFRVEIALSELGNWTRHEFDVGLTPDGTALVGTLAIANDANAAWDIRVDGRAKLDDGETKYLQPGETFESELRIWADTGAAQIHARRSQQRRRGQVLVRREQVPFIELIPPVVDWFEDPSGCLVISSIDYVPFRLTGTYPPGVLGDLPNLADWYHKVEVDWSRVREWVAVSGRTVPQRGVKVLVSTDHPRGRNEYCRILP